MIVIAILVVPFIFYFVNWDPSASRSDEFSRVYGRKVSQVEAMRYGKLYGLANALGMSRFVQDLSAGANSEREVIANMVILRHEADRLGIRPSAAEIADFVRNLQVFRGPSGFDIQKYNDFTQNVLSPNGFRETHIEELASNELCLNRIKEVVSTGVSVPESETKANYEQSYGKLFVEVIRLRTADFAKDIKVTDEDVGKYYETHKANLKTEEKRKVEWVSLGLSEEQKKLTGKERIDPLQKLADRANDFTQALLEKGADFQQVAAKFQVPVQATGEFTVAEPDPKLKADPRLGQTAFRLTKEEPNSDPVQVTDGFYILHLAGVVEARPLSLEEAKPKIVDAIKSNRARELVSNKGAKVAHDVREGLKAGEPLSFACEKAGVKAEKIEPFALMDELEAPDPAKPKKDKPADFIAIRNAVAGIQPGGVSEFFPWDQGGIVAVLEKREPPDAARYQDEKASFEERIMRNKRQIVFYEWLREKQREAGVVPEKSEAPPAGKSSTGS